VGVLKLQPTPTPVYGWDGVAYSNSNYDTYDLSLNLTPWPLPPAAAQRILVEQTINTCWWPPMETPHYHTWNSVLFKSSTNDTVLNTYSGWSRIYPLSRDFSDTAKFALGSGGHCGILQLGDSACRATFDEPGLSVGVISGMNSDGTFRIITPYSWGGVGVRDGMTLASIWTRNFPPSVQFSWVIYLEGGPDESILLWNSNTHRYYAYETSEGRFLDSTTVMNAQFWSPRRIGYRNDVVTDWESGRRLYVYAFGKIPPPSLVTIRLNPETNRLQLKWTPIGNATGYRIYMAGELTDNPYQVIGEVPATQTSFDFVPDPEKRFFYVTAKYGE
jgi:hypothetical protein